MYINAFNLRLIFIQFMEKIFNKKFKFSEKKNVLHRENSLNEQRSAEIISIFKRERKKKFRESFYNLRQLKISSCKEFLRNNPSSSLFLIDIEWKWTFFLELKNILRIEIVWRKKKELIMFNIISFSLIIEIMRKKYYKFQAKKKTKSKSFIWFFLFFFFCRHQTSDIAQDKWYFFLRKWRIYFMCYI